MLAGVSAEIAGETYRDYIDGLRDALGIEIVHNVAPALLRGGHVLLHGWRDLYCEAIHRHPGRCHVVWHHGWAATEECGEGGRLATVLQHQARGEIGLFWADLADVPPAGARHLPPLWRGDLLAKLAVEPQVRAPRSVMLDASTRLLAGLAATWQAAATIYVPRSMCTIAGSLHNVARAEVIAACGVDTEAGVRIYDGSSRVRRARCASAVELYVNLAPTPTWPYPAMDAIYSGTLALVGPAAPWTARLPDEIHAACVVDPASSTLLAAEMIGRLLDDLDLRQRALGAQRAVLDDLERKHKTIAREALAGAEIDLPAQAPAMLKDWTARPAECDV